MAEDRNPIIHLLADIQGKNGASYEVAYEHRKDIERWGSHPLVPHGAHGPVPTQGPKGPVRPRVIGASLGVEYYNKITPVPLLARGTVPAADGPPGARRGGPGGERWKPSHKADRPLLEFLIVIALGLSIVIFLR